MSRIFHFSEDPSIELFEPRPVLVPSERSSGLDRLNGPLVWAVAEEKQACYCFPRDCPRILLWLTDVTTAEDKERWWGDRASTIIAHIEWGWFETLARSPLYRYELPTENFEAVGEQNWGVVVSRAPVKPSGMEVISDVPAELRRLSVELRVMESLLPLRNAWETTLHVSGFRLRNAQGWR